MLSIGDNDVPYRIVGIDPGTDKMGFAVLDYHLDTKHVEVVQAYTLKTAQTRLLNPTQIEVDGLSYAKRQLILQHTLELLGYYQPHAFLAESPFLGKLPQAFEALIECRAALRQALRYYDPLMPMQMVSPKTAKGAVGAADAGKDKQKVADAVCALSTLNWADTIDKYTLDEHSIDAVAVAYTQVLTLQQAGY